MRLMLILLAVIFARAAEAATDPSATQGISYEQKLGAQLPLESIYADETGAAVRLGDLIHDRPVVLALVYFRCPNLCGVVMGDVLGALQAARQVPGQDYTLLAVSIDPSETAADAEDTKRRDMADFPTAGSAANWHFLTGTAPALDRLEQAVGYRARFDPALKQFIHPAGVVIVTPAGKVARYQLGVGYDPDTLKAGLRDAQAGSIAAAVQEILLTCWHYDPATGRYSLAIVGLLRVVGVLTALTIAIAIGLAFRREGRPR